MYIVYIFVCVICRRSLAFDGCDAYGKVSLSSCVNCTIFAVCSSTRELTEDGLDVVRNFFGSVRSMAKRDGPEQSIGSFYWVCFVDTTPKATNQKRVIFIYMYFFSWTHDCSSACHKQSSAFDL